MEALAVTGTLFAALGLCSIIETLSGRDLRLLPQMMFAYGLAAIAAYFAYS